ncbi:MAG: 50S ribosomal protein L33 [Planctomycetaceae bacterium]
MAREYVWLVCTETGDRNYRTSKEIRGTERLRLKTYCKKLRRHTWHEESRRSESGAARCPLPASSRATRIVGSRVEHSAPCEATPGR